MSSYIFQKSVINWGTEYIYHASCSPPFRWVVQHPDDLIRRGEGIRKKERERIFKGDAPGNRREIHAGETGIHPRTIMSILRTNVYNVHFYTSVYLFSLRLVCDYYRKLLLVRFVGSGLCCGWMWWIRYSGALKRHFFTCCVFWWYVLNCFSIDILMQFLLHAVDSIWYICIQ